VAPDGAVPTSLVAVPGVWCHRLGESTFRLLLDDRRPSHHNSPRQSRALRLAARPPGAVPRTPVAEPEPPATPPPASPNGAAETPGADDEAHGVRRIAQRLFGRAD
jgi:hypothetical protein